MACNAKKSLPAHTSVFKDIFLMFSAYFQKPEETNKLPAVTFLFVPTLNISTFKLMPRTSFPEKNIILVVYIQFLQNVPEPLF